MELIAMLRAKLLARLLIYLYLYQLTVYHHQAQQAFWFWLSDRSSGRQANCYEKRRHDQKDATPMTYDSSLLRR
jgi:hypothetical protein